MERDGTEIPVTGMEQNCTEIPLTGTGCTGGILRMELRIRFRSVPLAYGPIGTERNGKLVPDNGT